MRLKDYLIAGVCVALGAFLLTKIVFGQEPIDCAKTPDKCSSSAPLAKIAPVISDAQKVAAWKAQAMAGMSEVALKASKEYKEWEKWQGQVQFEAGKMSTVCGDKFQLQWTPEDITCVTKPKPETPKPLAH